MVFLGKVLTLSRSGSSMADSIDLTSDPHGSANQSGAGARRQQFVGVHFACCHVYRRVYLTPGEREVIAHCPRCAKKMTLHVVEGDGPRESTIQVG